MKTAPLQKITCDSMAEKKNFPMEETPEVITKLEIMAADSAVFFDFSESIQENKTPFFKSRSRRRRSDTWVISIFLIFHLVAFVATMYVNDCLTISRGDCAVKALRWFSFQPLTENPLLGPSASTLDKMGALRKQMVVERQTWHLFACPFLHAGLIHLIVNLTCVLFLGIYLEQEFGPLRIGIIYIVSAVFGTLVTASFVRDSPVACASGAQLGLLGATVSALLRNWRFYTNKAAAVLILFIVFACDFMLGLLPYTANYSNIGGLVSGFLLGFVLLSPVQLRPLVQNKSGLHDYGAKSFINLKQRLSRSFRSYFNLKQKLDRPILMIVSLLLFAFLFVGFLLVALQGINISQSCRWCGYFECIPSKSWSCNDLTTSCETMISDTETTLTCMGNGNFRVFPFTDISQERAKDLCTLLCS